MGDKEQKPPEESKEEKKGKNESKKPDPSNDNQKDENRQRFTDLTKGKVDNREDKVQSTGVDTKEKSDDGFKDPGRKSKRGRIQPEHVWLRTRNKFYSLDNKGDNQKADDQGAKVDQPSNGVTNFAN